MKQHEDFGNLNISYTEGLAPNRKFKTRFAFQKLATGVTEFKTEDGSKLYLSPILDLATGEIISFF